MRKLIVIFLILISIFSCKKDNSPEYSGTVADYSTLFADCNFVILLDNGTKLVPDVLPNNITLTNNQRVAVRYKSHPPVSTCAVGEKVEITSLRYL
jgi:hypothetical protein